MKGNQLGQSIDHFRPGNAGHKSLCNLRNHPPGKPDFARSEEHTSELQSHSDIVCRLLLEKKTHSTGGPPKIPFHTALTYITAKNDDALPRFRQFLQNDKGWPEEQIQIFLTAMADQWPAIDYPLFPNFGVTWVLFPLVDFD